MASVLSLQKLSELHASNVDARVKMDAAAKIADSTTEMLLCNPKEKDAKPRMSLDCEPHVSLLRLFAMALSWWLVVLLYMAPPEAQNHQRHPPEAHMLTRPVESCGACS